jgi:hypothetical protein
MVMMRGHRFRGACAVLVVALLAGCTYVGKYNPRYLVPWRIDPAQKLDGRALILTEVQDDAFVYSGHPTGFTGCANTLRLPLGVLARQSAMLVFGGLFREGVSTSNDRSRLDGYQAVISPRIVSFAYNYEWSLLSTTTIFLSVSVSRLDAHGNVVFEKTYDSGPVEGGSATGDAAGEAMNKAAHVTLQDLMLQAATDIKAQLEVRQSPAMETQPNATQPR